MPPFLVNLGPTRRVGLRMPTRGVRAPSAENAWIDDVLAVALVLPEKAAFSHQTAAHLLGLPIPSRLESSKPLHVTVPGQRGSRKAVKWHRAPIAGTVLARGVRVTDAQRTWLDLGTALTLPESVAVADVILRRGFVKTLSVPSGIRGAVGLRAAVELADPRSQSPKESILRVELHLAGLPKPEVNLNIYEQGDWVGRGDLVWPEYRLYVEYDGRHHGTDHQRHQDAQTRNRLGQLGWSVRVVTENMMKHVHEVVSMVTEDLVQAGWRG